MFYATIVVCWLGVGCFFGEKPDTYFEATCANAEAEMYEELVEGMGQPSKWEFACVNEEGMAALQDKYDLENQ